MMQTPCSACHGAGTVIKDPCQKCSGSGIQKKRKKISLDFPSGIFFFLFFFFFFFFSFFFKKKTILQSLI